MLLAFLHRAALVVERYAERIDRHERTYESAQLVGTARGMVRAVEVFGEWLKSEGRAI